MKMRALRWEWEGPSELMECCTGLLRPASFFLFLLLICCRRCSDGSKMPRLVSAAASNDLTCFCNNSRAVAHHPRKHSPPPHTHTHTHGRTDGRKPHTESTGQTTHFISTSDSGRFFRLKKSARSLRKPSRLQFETPTPLNMDQYV